MPDRSRPATRDPDAPAFRTGEAPITRTLPSGGRGRKLPSA